MRTVDPELWSRKLKKSKIKVTRRNRFGQQLGPRYEAILRESLFDTAAEFSANCSIPAVRLINGPDVTKLERYCYIVGFCLSLVTGTIMLTRKCNEILATPPLLISELPPEVSAADVSFPAVAICGNNVISRSALRNYTELLFNHLKNQNRVRPYSRSEIERTLQELGHLSLFAPPTLPIDTLIEFDSFLIDVTQCALSYCNVSNIMFKLSPPCASLLQRCSWRGEVLPCEALFAPRVTQLGFCCVFNSRYHDIDAESKPKTLDLTGMHYGLGVVIAENNDDSVYLRRRNWNGAEMLLFEGSQFPLLESGDVRQYPLPQNYSVTLNVQVITQKADDDVKVFSDTHRGCRLSGPGMAACLARCRSDAARGLCGCVPHALSADLASSLDHACALRHLYCLNEHREKLLALIPWVADAGEAETAEEISYGTYCEQCLVRCSRELYDVDASYARLSRAQPVQRSVLTKGLSLVNSSTVLVFFADKFRQDYALEAYMTWYEILGALSTQWMVITGVSVMAVLELFYHCTFRWTHHIIRRMRLANLRAP